MGGAPFCSGSFDTLDGGCRGLSQMFGGQTIWPQSTKYRLVGWLFDFVSDPKVAFLKPLVHLALGCDSKKVAPHKFCNDLPFSSTKTIMNLNSMMNLQPVESFEAIAISQLVEICRTKSPRHLCCVFDRPQNENITKSRLYCVAV